MLKINGVEDLPEWFDLKNYGDCENFDPANWLSNLWMRSIPWDHFMFPERPHRLDDTLIDGLLAHLREKPTTFTNAAPLTTPVRSLRFADLAERILSDRNQPDTARIWNETMSFDGVESRELRVPIGTITTLFDTGHPVMVDLQASDTVLIGAFKTWLKEARASKAAEAPSKRERLKHESWARYGLLAYLDLRIWSVQVGASITSEIMTAAVLPSVEPMGNTRIRDTVAPLAERLMADLSELEALAAFNASGEGRAQ